MHTNLTAEQPHACRRAGHVVQRGFLDAAEAAERKAAGLDCVAPMGRRKVADGGKRLAVRDVRLNDDWNRVVWQQASPP